MKFPGRAARFVPETIPGDHDIERDRTLFDIVGFGGRRRSVGIGVEILVRTVLEEAIRNYLGADPRRRRDAASWLAAARQPSPVEFGVVCKALGLEPNVVRGVLEQVRFGSTSRSKMAERDRAGARRSGRLPARKAG
jgi:hypothetical protein